MTGKYEIRRDSYNRLHTHVDGSFAMGVKLLAEDHRRRVEQNIHAYVVADLMTELGPWRIRDIRIMYGPESERYYVRYRRWRTGKVRDNRDEYLDVAGPLDKETRRKVQEAILAVFFQIREEAKAGTLGRLRSPSDPSTIGDNAEVAAQLESLKETLVADVEADAPEVAVTAESEVAVEAAVAVEVPETEAAATEADPA